MEVDFRKKKKEGKLQFKLFGVVTCRKCAEGWKHTLMDKGKRVRLTRGEKGWEVWAL